MEAVFGNDWKDLIVGKASDDATVVCLYFSAHWCPPCRGFTPKLAQVYTDAKAAGESVEIVFVSSDRDQKSFDDYFASMPWVALKFEARDLKAQLSTKYEVSGIPSLVLLDGKTGQVLTTDGRSFVMEHGPSFPGKALAAPAAKAAATAAVKDLSIIGDSAVDSTGTAVSLAQIASNTVIAIAFGDPENRGWAQFVKPKLAEAYKELKARGEKFEVLYVSMADTAEAAAGEDWLQLPHKHNLDMFKSAFSVASPHVVVLSGSGDVLVEDAARDVYEMGASGWPWTTEAKEKFKGAEAERVASLGKQMENLQIFSGDNDSFLGSGGVKIPIATIKQEADVIGLYFSAHWCPPCRGFTPELAKIYTACKEAGKSFEIVFVSSDRDQASFDEYFASMPWKALAYDKRSLKSDLNTIYGVEGIPSLVLIGSDGSLITKAGREAVGYGPECFPWTPELMEAGKATKARKDEEAAQAAVDKENATAAQQAAAGKVVFKRHRGVPGTSDYDAGSNTIQFNAFDTFVTGGGASSGKLFYEITAVNVDQGIAQVGWADMATFTAGTSRSGEGTGDDVGSWAFDGNRVTKWNNGSTEWGKAWKSGDVLGCAIDLDAKKVLFGLNGDWGEATGWGVAFEGISFTGQVVAAVSAQGNAYKLKMNFGGETFVHGGPDASFKPLQSLVTS